MTQDEKNFYLYGVLAASEYISTGVGGIRQRVLGKFNLTPKKIDDLKKWMDAKLKESPK